MSRVKHLQSRHHTEKGVQNLLQIARGRSGVHTSWPVPAITIQNLSWTTTTLVVPGAGREVWEHMSKIFYGPVTTRPGATITADHVNAMFSTRVTTYSNLD